MSGPVYRGLTWDHPRGYEALEAAAEQARQRGEVNIVWERQPLEGFEEHRIDELCAAYDIVVLDHPHIGQAVSLDCLIPLGSVFDAASLAKIRDRTIGPCFESYDYADRQWALPLDAATQVMAYRPDLIGQAPTSWEEVADLAASRPMVLSLAGPHAALTLFSIALSIDPQFAVDGRLFARGVGEQAFKLMTLLFRRSAPVARDLNPIGILEMMAATRDIALCPLIYGYVNYAGAQVAAPRRRLAFADAPVSNGGGRGSILGGTGIALSKRCPVTPELIRHLAWLMDEDAQVRFVPAHNGQPSNRQAWADPQVNDAWGGFYRDTTATLEGAHVRPRYDGFIQFQHDAAQQVRLALTEAWRPADAIAALESLFATSLPEGKQR